MGEEHRKRERHFKLWLFDEEMEILNEKALAASMSKSEYVRNVILFGAARGKTNFSREDAKKIVYELNRIGNNINQIAYQANYNCAVSENNFFSLKNEFIKLLGEFETIAIE